MSVSPHPTPINPHPHPNHIHPPTPILTQPGKTGYKGTLRHRDPRKCDHGATGRMVIHRYTIRGENLPDPTVEKRAAW